MSDEACCEYDCVRPVIHGGAYCKVHRDWLTLTKLHNKLLGLCWETCKTMERIVEVNEGLGHPEAEEMRKRLNTAHAHYDVLRREDRPTVQSVAELHERMT